MYIHPVPKGTAGICVVKDCEQLVEAIFYYEKTMGGVSLALCTKHNWEEDFEYLMSVQMKCPTCKSEAASIAGVDEHQAYAECELGHIYMIEPREDDDNGD